jgi:hypothetical protein
MGEIKNKLTGNDNSLSLEDNLLWEEVNSWEIFEFYITVLLEIQGFKNAMLCLSFSRKTQHNIPEDLRLNEASVMKIIF